MANTHTTLGSLFSAIANAIRSKTGNSGSIVADNFPDAINSITTLSDGTADATATAGQILTGQTAYVKGSKVAGTMSNQGAKTTSLNCGGSYTIPAGYHNGSGKVTANSLASQTAGTATAADIASGKTAYVNGAKVTGTKPVQNYEGFYAYLMTDSSYPVFNDLFETRDDGQVYVYGGAAQTVIYRNAEYGNNTDNPTYSFNVEYTPGQNITVKNSKPGYYRWRLYICKEK